LPKFKVNVSDPETGTCKTVEIEGEKAVPLLGLKIGDIIDGAILGLPGHKIQITGGSDKDGFPMRPDVHGGVRAYIILSDKPGFRPKFKGHRERKRVRGNVITEDIVQVNVKIVEKPKPKAKRKRKKVKVEEKKIEAEKREGEAKATEATETSETAEETSES